MIKLKVSYEYPEELQQLLARLGPSVKHWKTARQQGRFKRAYLELKNTNTGSSENT